MILKFLYQKNYPLALFWSKLKTKPVFELAWQKKNRQLYYKLEFSPNIRFFADMSERTATKVIGFHLDEGFSLTATLLEKELVRQREAGVAVKAFLYCNPHNPLGVVYPKELTLQLMEVCKEHQVVILAQTFVFHDHNFPRSISYPTRSTPSLCLMRPPPSPASSVSQRTR